MTLRPNRYIIRVFELKPDGTPYPVSSQVSAGSWLTLAEARKNAPQFSRPNAVVTVWNMKHQKSYSI